jgi:hypothetical protein
MSPPIAHDGIQVLHFYILVSQEQIVYEPFTARRTHNTDPATTTHKFRLHDLSYLLFALRALRLLQR